MYTREDAAVVDRYNSRGMFKACGMCNSMPQQNCKNDCKNELKKECKNDCKKLLERLREIDFSLVDTVLYLDAYPHSTEALGYYQKLKCERSDLVKTLAEGCNMPMTAFDNYGDVWSWTDAPWPWEMCAN